MSSYFLLCVACLALTNVFISIGVLRQVKRLKQIVESYVTGEIADELGYDVEDTMTAEEREAIEELQRRTAEFDVRIAKLKDELAKQQPEKPNYSSEAEILHPGVYNLPHDSVIENRNYDSEEYAR